MNQKYIRMAALATTSEKEGRLPVSAATIWRWVREGNFPKPIRLGASVTVWDLAEVDQFIARRATEAN